MTLKAMRAIFSAGLVTLCGFNVWWAGESRHAVWGLFWSWMLIVSLRGFWLDTRTVRQADEGS